MLRRRFRQFISAVLLVTMPVLCLADPVTQGLYVNVPCNPNQLSPGGVTNDAVAAAIGTVLGANWTATNGGIQVVARFADLTQVTFAVNQFGVLVPQGSCVPQDTSLWSWYSVGGSGTIMEGNGQDFNGDGDSTDSFSANCGVFRGPVDPLEREHDWGW